MPTTPVHKEREGNVMKHFLKIIITLAITLSVPRQSCLAGTELKFSIIKLLQSRGLSASDIYWVNSIGRPDNVQWAIGSKIDFVRQNLILEAIDGGSMPIGNSLKVDYNNKDINLSLCNSLDICSYLKTEKAGVRYKFAIEGSEFAINLYGNPCNDGGSCDIVFKSWYLERGRLTNKLQSWPKLLTYVAYTDGIAAIDPESGQMFSEIKSELTISSDLGKVIDISLSNSGLLRLKHDNGAQLWDIRNDRLTVINDRGIILSKQGLGAFGNGPSQSALNKVPSSYLGSSDAIAVWQDGHVKFDPGADTSELISGVFIPLNQIFTGMGINKSKVQTFSFVDGNLVFYQYDERQNKFILLTSSFVANNETQAKNLKILNSSMVVQSSSGLISLGSKGTEERTSLSGTQKEIKLDGSDGVFVQDFSDHDCVWKHLRQHQTVKASYKETGLTGNCSLLNGFSSSDVNAITSFDGTAITVNFR